MKIVQFKTEVRIDEQGNASILPYNLDEKQVITIEELDSEDPKLILTISKKVKEHNERELKVLKAIVGNNSNGHIDFQLLK